METFFIALGIFTAGYLVVSAFKNYKHSGKILIPAEEMTIKLRIRGNSFTLPFKILRITATSEHAIVKISTGEDRILEHLQKTEDIIGWQVKIGEKTINVTQGDTDYMLFSDLDGVIEISVVMKSEDKKLLINFS